MMSADPLDGELSDASICERIRKKGGVARVTCQRFESTPWREKESALSRLGFVHLDSCSWFEVSSEDSIKLLSAALARDLCYRARVMAASTATELASEFLSLLHWQTRFFTNSEVPYHRRGNGWMFHPITEATVDTGVIAKTGKELSAILWVQDID